MRAMNVVRKYGRKVAAVGGVSGLALSQAQAAVPTAVTDALTDAKTDALAVAGLALVVIIAIAAFKYMRRGV